MLNNLKVLRQAKEIKELKEHEQPMTAPCLKGLSFFVIEKQNGYREGKCPVCGRRIFAHGDVVGHDR